MQIGIDIGASKIESVILDENGACLETKSVYFDITNTKGIPRNSH